MGEKDNIDGRTRVLVNGPGLGQFNFHVGGGSN